MFGPLSVSHLVQRARVNLGGLGLVGVPVRFWRVQLHEVRPLGWRRRSVPSAVVSSVVVSSVVVSVAVV